jgi:hypothetical protein
MFIEERKRLTKTKKKEEKQKRKPFILISKVEMVTAATKHTNE